MLLASCGNRAQGGGLERAQTDLETGAWRLEAKRDGSESWQVLAEVDKPPWEEEGLPWAIQRSQEVEEGGL